MNDFCVKSKPYHGKIQETTPSSYTAHEELLSRVGRHCLQGIYPRKAYVCIATVETVL